MGFKFAFKGLEEAFVIFERPFEVLEKAL